MVKIIENWIRGEGYSAESNGLLNKVSPVNGALLFQVVRSQISDVDTAVRAARAAQVSWAATPAVQRGLILLEVVELIKSQKNEIAEIVALETGKSKKDALGEVGAAIQCGLFYASEGQRLYGKTCTSGVVNKFALTVRQPRGVAGLIIAANTPIANVAWKVFPALICGNTAVLKAAEDTPATAWLFGKLAHDAGLPPGVLNIIQGLGAEAGQALVEHPDVDVISFTGSTRVGKIIQCIANERFARVSLELGGKNALLVCDDADIPNAVKWTILSAFSNAGQRCAAASRVIIFESVYEKFKALLIDKTNALKVGTSDDCDFGPVINERQLTNMLNVVADAKNAGAKILTGGNRLLDADHAQGFFCAPTLLENVSINAPISQTELFGPIAILYPAKDLAHALELTNNSCYGLTSCIHTKSFDRALWFCNNVKTGVAVVNAGTFGSEPHMPFGGFKQSGNGSREPGTEALDVYSELKDIYLNIDTHNV